MQGWRISKLKQNFVLEEIVLIDLDNLDMEDAHTHILALPEDKSCAFLAVYDGHGGAKVAQYSCKYLHTRIANQPEFSMKFSCSEFH